MWEIGNARPVVLVLGGTGFIGRHVVSALLARGCGVVVGSRHPHRHATTDPATELREAHLERLLQASQWHALLHDCDGVVNCVGILRERGRETYQRVHHLAPAALAAACEDSGTRFIHVSALGLAAPVRSGFLRSKQDGEAALRASNADWHIVRPSLLDGEGGFGARWIRRVARWPIHPLPRGATGRLAVLDVGDLGIAIAALAQHGAEERELRLPDPVVREHDLGGVRIHTLAEHLAAMRALNTTTPARLIHIPDWLARAAAHVCDVLHWTPFSFGHWELLRRDNVPLHNRLPVLLGRVPRGVGAAVPAHTPQTISDGVVEQARSA